MYKKILKITLFILVNLLAFLLFWSILGAIFWNKQIFLIASIVFSMVPLTIYLFIEIKKTIIEINSINNKTDDWNSK